MGEFSNILKASKINMKRENADIDGETTQDESPEVLRSSPLAKKGVSRGPNNFGLSITEC